MPGPTSADRPGFGVGTTHAAGPSATGRCRGQGWTWAPVAGSVGDTLYCQALCLDLAANEFGFTLSNEITIRLVP